MSEATFAVVIPTYDRGHMIGRTIETVLRQTLLPKEIIVVDDGSTDDTGSVVSRYSGVTYVRQLNAERAVARNNGASRAHTTHVAFLDSDDGWHPDHLRTVADRITAATPFAYTRASYVFADGRRLPSRNRYRSGWVTRHLIRGNMVEGNAAIVSARAFELVGGFCTDRNVIGSEDWDLWVRLSVRYPFVHIPIATAEIGVHPDRTSYDPNVLERCKIAALEHLFADPLVKDALAPYRREAWFYGLLFVALGFYRADQQARAREYLFRAFAAWPRGVLDPRFGATLLKSFVGRGTVEKVRSGRGFGRT